MASTTDDFWSNSEYPIRKRNLWVRATLYLTGVAFVCMFAFLVFVWDPRANLFDKRSSSAELLSLTEKQVIQKLGLPTFKTLDADSLDFFTFRGPSGHYCRIEFKAGIAVKVTHWVK